MPLTTDWRSLREDVRDERLEQQAAAEAATPSRSAVQQSNMMDEMGLDADDALQYAMMLSMEESSAPTSSLASPRTEEDCEEGWAVDDAETYGDVEDGVDEVDEAIRAVEEFKRAEEEEMRRAMESIRLAEGR